MFSRNHVTQRPVRQAVKITRSALNHALDVAEPRLERAAGNLEDLSRDALASLRKRSLDKLDYVRAGVGIAEKRLRRRVTPLLSRRRLGKVAWIAAGLAILAFGVYRSS